jgi:lactobin A/cerein 7B family class IIb bacteriocin
MKNLEKFGVQELNETELKETQGGFWLLITAALIGLGIGLFIGHKIWNEN